MHMCLFVYSDCMKFHDSFSTPSLRLPKMFMPSCASRSQVGSPERAAVFFQEFLRSGIDINGHVRPQVEFMLPVEGCSVPMDFIGKDEELEADWQKMFALQNETVPSFDSNLATHSHGDTDHLAMENFLGYASAGNSSASTDGARYVRALCWLFLVDFAVFDYELPAQCQHELMADALALLPSMTS